MAAIPDTMSKFSISDQLANRLYNAPVSPRIIVTLVMRATRHAVSYMRLNRRTKSCARISIRTSFLEYSVCCKPNRQNQH
ncbi:hypothetical protein VTN00DRAFT_202 [Thermoascus crustaceus]|uniref:uncharacterized protein n=1 Tax=Thermoascus crustaceus TaxID=5088 RepID=UPI0037427F99